MRERGPLMKHRLHRCWSYCQTQVGLGDTLLGGAVTASLLVLVTLGLTGWLRSSPPGAPVRPAAQPATLEQTLAPWAFDRHASDTYPSVVRAPMPSASTWWRWYRDDPEVPVGNPEAAASVVGEHLGEDLEHRLAGGLSPSGLDRPDRRDGAPLRTDAQPRDLAAGRGRAEPGRWAVSDDPSSDGDTDATTNGGHGAGTTGAAGASSTAANVPDQGGLGVELLPRFVEERDPMDRMRPEVACTAVCDVQAVVAPKAYLTLSLLAQDQLGRVSLDDPRGWAVKGYYAQGLVPTLRVEDTGTLVGHPPAPTWLHVRTGTRTVNVRLTPEAPGLVALPIVQVTDAALTDGAAGWFKPALGTGAGL